MNKTIQAFVKVTVFLTYMVSHIRRRLGTSYVRVKLDSR